MDYLIGKLEGATVPFPMQTTGRLHATPANPVTPTNVQDENDNTMYFGAAAVIAVVVVYFLYSRRKPT